MARSESKYFNALKEKCKTSSLTDLYDELKTANILLFIFHLFGIMSAIFTYMLFVNSFYATGVFLFIIVIFIAGIVSVGQKTKTIVKEYISKKVDS